LHLVHRPERIRKIDRVLTTMLLEYGRQATLSMLDSDVGAPSLEGLGTAEAGTANIPPSVLASESSGTAG